jgi:predicted transcriptional regulator
MNADLREAWERPDNKMGGTSTLYVKDAKEAYEVLSEERLSLLKHMMDYSPRACVSDLVKKTGRKQEAISRDLSILEKHGAIEKKKKGTKTFIEPKIDSIEIKFK